MMSLLILLDYFELWLRDRPTDIGKNGMDRHVRRHFAVLCSFESHCQQPPFRRAGMRNCGVFFCRSSIMDCEWCQISESNSLGGCKGCASLRFSTTNSRKRVDSAVALPAT